MPLKLSVLCLLPYAVNKPAPIPNQGLSVSRHCVRTAFRYNSWWWNLNSGFNAVLSKVPDHSSRFNISYTENSNCFQVRISILSLFTFRLPHHIFLIYFTYIPPPSWRDKNRNLCDHFNFHKIFDENSFSQLHLLNTPLPAISLFLEERLINLDLYMGQRPMFLLIGAVSISIYFFTSAKKRSNENWFAFKGKHAKGVW